LFFTFTGHDLNNLFVNLLDVNVETKFYGLLLISAAILSIYSAFTKFHWVRRILDMFKSKTTLMRERDEAINRARLSAETSLATIQASQGWHEAFNSLDRRQQDDAKERREFEQMVTERDRQTREEIQALKESQARMNVKLIESLKYNVVVIKYATDVHTYISEVAPLVKLPDIPPPPKTLLNIMDEYDIVIDF